MKFQFEEEDNNLATLHQRIHKNLEFEINTNNSLKKEIELIKKYSDNRELDKIHQDDQ